MNAILDAIKVLRDLDMRSDLIVELEALLKQEPVSILVRKDSWPVGSYDLCGTGNNNYGRGWAGERFPVYRTPRPPCDLKALAEDVRDSVMNDPLMNPDLDAIIAKHTGGK